jgi:hypothetical protein
MSIQVTVGAKEGGVEEVHTGKGGVEEQVEREVF